MTGREAPINPDNIVQADKRCIGDVLDIGCGNVKTLGDVTLDADPAAAPDVVADLREGIPFGDDSFKTVTALHVLEHLEDDVGLWSEMQRVASRRVVAVVPLGMRDDPDHEHVYWNVDEVVDRFSPSEWTTSSMAAYTDCVFWLDI